MIDIEMVIKYLLEIALITSNIHDSNLVKDTLDDIKIKIVRSILGGDKGYISKDTKNINLITNLKELINNDEKLFLKKRHIVENIFSWL